MIVSSLKGYCNRYWRSDISSVVSISLPLLTLLKFPNLTLHLLFLLVKGL